MKPARAPGGIGADKLPKTKMKEIVMRRFQLEISILTDVRLLTAVWTIPPVLRDAAFVERGNCRVLHDRSLLSLPFKSFL